MRPTYATTVYATNGESVPVRYNELRTNESTIILYIIQCCYNMYDIENR
jgi:hypothetical protein